jgi:hypothetical protein
MAERTAEHVETWNDGSLTFIRSVVTVYRYFAGRSGEIRK